MASQVNSTKHFSSVQFSSGTQSCLTLCDPMNCSTSGLPVYHPLLEFIQTHVPWVSDAIQPSHPLSSPSSPAFNLSQHQGLFQWVSSLIQVASASASVLLVNIQDWFPLRLTGLYLQFKELSRVSSNTTVQKHQFFGTQLSLWSNSYYPKTAVLKRPCVLQLFQPFSARHQIYVLLEGPQVILKCSLVENY